VRSFVVVVAVLESVGCAADSGIVPDGGAVGVDAVVAVDGFVAPIHLSDIEQQVFAVSCVFSVCHGLVSPQRGLSLVAPTFDTIVGKPSTEVPDKMRVAPGHPDRSYLLEKLERETPTDGKKMPPDQHLDAATIQMVRTWIEQGAKND
jgi:hypothetical protein